MSRLSEAARPGTRVKSKSGKWVTGAKPKTAKSVRSQVIGDLGPNLRPVQTFRKARPMPKTKRRRRVVDMVRRLMPRDRFL